MFQQGRNGAGWRDLLVPSNEENRDEERLERFVHKLLVCANPEPVGRPTLGVRGNGEALMVVYIMLGLIVVIAFLCVSRVIPELTNSRLASGSSSPPDARQMKK